MLFFHELTDTSPPTITVIMSTSIQTSQMHPNVLLVEDFDANYDVSEPSRPLQVSVDPPIGLPRNGGSLFPPGDTTVTLRVTDAYGNTAEQEFTVTNWRK